MVDISSQVAFLDQAPRPLMCREDSFLSDVRQRGKENTGLKLSVDQEKV